MVMPADLRTAARERVRQEEARLGFTSPPSPSVTTTARTASLIAHSTPMGVTCSLTRPVGHPLGLLTITNSTSYALDVRVFNKSGLLPRLFLVFPCGVGRGKQVTSQFAGAMASLPLKPPLLVEIWTRPSPDGTPVKLGHFDLEDWT